MTSSALHSRTILGAWLIGQVKTGMTELGLSQQRVAKELDISEKHMSQLMTGRTPGSIDLWDRMLHQVGMRAVSCPLGAEVPLCADCDGEGCETCARYVVRIHDSYPGSVDKVRWFHDRTAADGVVAHYARINGTRNTYGIRAEMTDRKQATKET